MFVALVLIAAVLIRLHHKVEYYILKRLTVKNRLLRLEAARRTVATLEKQIEPENKTNHLAAITFLMFSLNALMIEINSTILILKISVQ